MKRNSTPSPRGSLNDTFTSRAIRYPLIHQEMENLMGKVLTVIDSSIVDQNQNKAVKDLMRAAFSDKINQVFWDYCYRTDFIWKHDSYFIKNIVDGELKHSETESMKPLIYISVPAK